MGIHVEQGPCDLLRAGTSAMPPDPFTLDPSQNSNVPDVAQRACESCHGTGESIQGGVGATCYCCDARLRSNVPEPAQPVDFVELAVQAGQLVADDHYTLARDEHPIPDGCYEMGCIIYYRRPA